MGFIFAIAVCILLAWGKELFTLLCFLIPAALLIYVIYHFAKNSDSYNPDKVNRPLADSALLFFNNYLSLCANRHAVGHAYMCISETTQLGYDVVIGCKLFRVDHTSPVIIFKARVDTLNGLISAASSIESPNRKAEEWKRLRSEFEDNTKEYFGCRELHYCFSDADEYNFDTDDDRVTFEYHRFLPNQNSTWPDTVKAIKTGLLQQWPEASITFKDGVLTL